MPNYEVKDNKVYRDDVAVATIDNNKVVTIEGFGQFKLQAAKAYKNRPAEDIIGDQEKIETVLERKTREQKESSNGVARLPFGLPVKEGIPDHPPLLEAGTKTPAFVEWVIENYPEESEILYEQFFKNKKSKLKRLIEKQAK